MNMDSSEKEQSCRKPFSTIQTFEGEDGRTLPPSGTETEPELSRVAGGFGGSSGENKAGGGGELVSLRQQIPANILIVALLEHLSSLYVEDPTDSRKLFTVLMRQLVENKILPQLGSIDEVSSLRSQYKAAFSRLIHAAVGTIKHQGLNVPSAGTLKERVEHFLRPRWNIRQPFISFANEVVIQTSRYREEFSQSGLIDSGAYGSVFKALNKLDGCEYAIKKIPLYANSKEILQKIMREVKLLAQISHKNVVRYHNSWIELSHNNFEAGHLPALTYENSKSRNYKGDSRLSDDSVVFKESSSPGIVPNTDFPTMQPIIEDSSSPSSEISPPVPMNAHTQYTPEVLVLHIQMELCVSNLKEWLAKRNHRLLSHSFKSNYDVIEYDLNKHMIKHLLKAVRFIHENDLIHRDIKPKNIFLAPDWSPKLGDFGLARYCDDQPFTPSPGFKQAPDSTYYTSGIGTTLYAAPEQLTQTVYTKKCDMYSIGVVLFEMYQPFATEMERVESLRELRYHRLLPPGLSIRWPKLSELILQLLDEDPSHRPSALDLLQSELFMTKDQIINQLKSDKDKHMAHIAAIEEELQEKIRELQRIKSKLCKNCAQL